MSNHALINVLVKDKGEYLEVTEYWDLSHPDCPFVMMEPRKEWCGVQYLATRDEIRPEYLESIGNEH